VYLSPALLLTSVNISTLLVVRRKIKEQLEMCLSWCAK
jgi:hypothetical protein